MLRIQLRAFAMLGVLVLLSSSVAAAEPQFKLKRGDHICLIGNTLADRMQHDGWLETLLQHRFPKHELVIRNLGYSADEIALRPREQNFGSPDMHLTHSKADVIFAFFGYNESFSGEAGLATFRKQLEGFLDNSVKQKYNGTSAPRVVLFSPIAHEDLHSPHLPDGKDNNARLAMYTKAMAEVAADRKIPFVDLFHPSRDVFAKSKTPLTINGIHPTDDGNRVIAEIIDAALFGKAIGGDEARLNRLREAVLDKNLHWFNNYRVTDGYNVYGGRSKTGNYDGQTNATISKRELEIFEVKTANRDRRIWAIAQGGDLKIDDSNTPPPLTIKTNKPGKNPDGSHPFLGGEEAIKMMTVHKGMSVNLFASEEKFPRLINPVQASVDADGKLFVAVWPSYPHWHPNEELKDAILTLIDDDGDGKADRCVVFADKLHNPTGFEFWGGGILVCSGPDLLFLKDTKGDGVADVRIRILSGIDTADTHHTANSFVIGPDGALLPERHLPGLRHRVPLFQAVPTFRHRRLPLRSAHASDDLPLSHRSEPARRCLRPLGQPVRHRRHRRFRQACRLPTAQHSESTPRQDDSPGPRHWPPCRQPFSTRPSRQSAHRQRDRFPGRGPVQVRRQGIRFLLRTD